MLEIKIKDLKENTKLVILEGVLDNTTVSQIEEHIDPLVNEPRALFLIFDLSKLTYLNSTGIAKLLQYHLRLNLHQGQFKIFGVSDLIREILDICGALRMLEIYSTQEQALGKAG